MSASQVRGVRAHVRDVATFLGGNVGTNVIALVGSLLVARWTEPADMGRWTYALLIATYLSALQLGVFNGLNRQIPYYAGRQDAERSLQMAEAAYAWCIALSVASMAVSAAIAVYFVATSEWTALGTGLAISVVVTSSWSLQYLTVTHSANGHFTQLARKTLAAALIGLILAPLTLAFGYAALLIRAAVLAVITSALLHRERPMPVKPRWDFAALLELGRVGLPVWLVGQVAALVMTLDRVVLSNSATELGHYTVAVQFATMASMIPVAFNAVFYPQMARRYGQTHAAGELWSLALKASAFASVAGIIAGAIGWISVPWFIKLVLPAYIQGTAAAQWAALMGAALGFSIFNNIFNVLGRQDVYLVCALLGVAVFFGLWFTLAGLGTQPRLVCAAQSMIGAALATSLLSTFASRFICKRHDAGRLSKATP